MDQLAKHTSEVMVCERSLCVAFIDAGKILRECITVCVKKDLYSWREVRKASPCKLLCSVI